MCKEMLVIPVNKMVDPKRIIGKKWRAEEEERHKGSLTQKKTSVRPFIFLNSRKCSPRGGERRGEHSPRDQRSPLTSFF
jgi:hypothetical protein